MQPAGRLVRTVLRGGLVLVVLGVLGLQAVLVTPSAISSVEDRRRSIHFSSSPIPGELVSLDQAMALVEGGIPMLPEVPVTEPCEGVSLVLSLLDTWVSLPVTTASPSRQIGQAYNGGVWMSVSPEQRFALQSYPTTIWYQLIKPSRRVTDRIGSTQLPSMTVRPGHPTYHPRSIATAAAPG